MPTRPGARIASALALFAILGLAVPTALAASRGVSIRDFAFAPKTIEVRVGDRVTWTNRDTVEHTATARNGSFDTGLIGEGESHSVRFTVAGTYRYVCTPHPNMTGTVVVRAGGLQPPNTDALAVIELGSDARPAMPLEALALIGLLLLIGTFVADRRFHRR